MMLPCKLLASPPPSDEPPMLWSRCFGSYTGLSMFGRRSCTLAAVLLFDFAFPLVMNGLTSTCSNDWEP